MMKVLEAGGSWYSVSNAQRKLQVLSEGVVAYDEAGFSGVPERTDAVKIPVQKPKATPVIPASKIKKNG